MLSSLLSEPQHHNLLFYGGWVYTILIGLAIGSFLNVCIDRLPLQFLSATEKQALLSNPGLSETFKQHLQANRLTIATPIRSFCFQCGHTLAWYENIPVVSYFYLKGRCRQCHVSYGMRSVWIELLNGAIYGMLYGILGVSVALALGALNSSVALMYGGLWWSQQPITKQLARPLIGVGALDLGTAVWFFH